MGPWCEACHWKGWLLCENDVHGWRIERCDACFLYATDEEAVKAVAEQAESWLLHQENDE
jgi:hypothetical protein